MSIYKNSMATYALLGNEIPFQFLEKKLNFEVEQRDACLEKGIITPNQ